MFFFFQAEDGIRDVAVTGVQTCALPICLIEASPHDAAKAYLAVDTHKLDIYRPYIFRTNDFGKTWTKIVAGLPENTYVHAVREDPRRRGLLFAGTETGVLVSFDDGARWQPLQLNLPTTPIHDLRETRTPVSVPAKSSPRRLGSS